MQPGDDFEWDKDNEEKLLPGTEWTGMKPNKLQLTSGHLSRGLVRIGPGTPSTSSWERQTMAASCLW